MSYLMYALDTLESVACRLEKYPEESDLLKEVKETIRTIEETEKDICATCEHCEYYSDRYTPPTNTCGCEQSEYSGEDCTLWYGDEECPHYKKQVLEDMDKESYKCEVCGKLITEDEGCTTTINGLWVCDNDSCRTLDEDNNATER